jgi:hypothetical protein
VRDEWLTQFKEAMKHASPKVQEDAALVAVNHPWYVDPVKEYPTLRLKNPDSFYNGLRDAAPAQARPEHDALVACGHGWRACSAEGGRQARL